MGAEQGAEPQTLSSTVFDLIFKGKAIIFVRGKLTYNNNIHIHTLTADFICAW